MAEQTLPRRSTVSLRSPVSHAAPAVVPSVSSQEAMRRAKSCLEAASRRLKRGEPGKTDEALNLLRAAAAHLQQACAPTSVPGADLGGAE